MGGYSSSEDQVVQSFALQNRKAMKLTNLHSRETIKKFTVVTYGKDLALELGQDVPEVYGGKGKDLSHAITPKTDG